MCDKNLAGNCVAKASVVERINVLEGRARVGVASAARLLCCFQLQQGKHMLCEHAVSQSAGPGNSAT